MDLETVIEKTRQIVADVVAADAEEIDRDARWPERALRAFQQAGLAGLVVPEQAGGLGHSLLGLARVCEQIGRECPSTALCFGMHCVASAVIAAKATEEQQQYLHAINEGKHLTTLALSEPGTGCNFYFPQTRLIPGADGGFCVEGTKHFVTNGGFADSYVISTVAAAPDAPAYEFSCVVIDGDSDGLVWGPEWQGLGMRGNQSRTLELHSVSVGRSSLLGAEGDELWYMFQVVAPYFLMAMAGTYVGLASTALDEARTHMSRRHFSHSGSSLASLSVLQHRLGKLWGTVEKTRRLVYWAAMEADSGGDDALAGLCAAKADVADCAVHVVNEAMTLCGGIAYRDNSRLGRLLRDARASHVMAPTTDLLLTWAGRALLGEPLLGD